MTGKLNFQTLFQTVMQECLLFVKYNRCDLELLESHSTHGFQVSLNGNGAGSLWASYLTTIGTNTQIDVKAVSVYPNPFTSEVQVGFNATGLGTTQVRILNIQGLVVGKQIADVSHGVNRIAIENLTTLPKGMYFVELTVNGETTVVKVEKV